MIERPMIESFVFCTPKAYSPLKITFISLPRSHATGPIMNVVLCDMIIPVKIKPPEMPMLISENKICDFREKNIFIF